MFTRKDKRLSFARKRLMSQVRKGIRGQQGRTGGPSTDGNSAGTQLTRDIMSVPTPEPTSETDNQPLLTEEMIERQWTATGRKDSSLKKRHPTYYSYWHREPGGESGDSWWRGKWSVWEWVSAPKQWQRILCNAWEVTVTGCYTANRGRSFGQENFCMPLFTGASIPSASEC